MQLLFGTYNPAKVKMLRKLLAPLGITMIGLSDLEVRPPEADETGATPLENARIKALVYHHATGMTTLAADSGLYLDGVSSEQQPGEHARRLNGERMDDEAMIAYYAGVARSHGGRVAARYRNALCIAFADGRTADIFDDSVASDAFYLVDTPHMRRTPGFPLDSLSVEIQSGKYYFDLDRARADGDLAQRNGMVHFIRGALGICYEH